MLSVVFRANFQAFLCNQTEVVGGKKNSQKLAMLLVEGKGIVQVLQIFARRQKRQS